MKRYRIRYRDNYFSTEEKFVIIIAESPQDANDRFFDLYSGTIFETEFVGWV